MIEPMQTQITFDYRQLVTMMLKEQGIHDGVWGLYVEFNMFATNVGPSESELIPAAIVGIKKIGLQKMEAASSLSVDAADVNPAPVTRQRAVANKIGTKGKGKA